MVGASFQQSAPSYKYRLSRYREYRRPLASTYSQAERGFVQTAASFLVKMLAVLP